MTRYLALILALLAASITYADQPLPPTSFQSGGNITSANAACNVGNCIVITLPAIATTLSVGVTGTFSATLAVERSQDGGRTWTSAGSNITSAGTTTYTITAFTHFRVRASAFVSGNAGVNLVAGPAGSSSSSGSGTPGGANTDIQFNDGGSFGGDANLTWDKTTGSFNAQGTGAFQGLSSGPALNNFVSVTPTAISLAANESGATGTFSSDGTFSINSAHGNVAISAVAGLINFGSGAAAHLTDAGALTVTSCTGCGGGGSVPTGTGFTHNTGGVQDGASKLVNLTAATDVAANQGTTTTVFHGNAAGQGSFGAVALATDVSGQLPIAAVGSAGLSGTAPVTIASTGAIACATCNTSAGALTNNTVLKGAGSQGIQLASITDDGTTITMPEITSFTKAGAASVNSVKFIGTLFTGGSATTTFPNVLIDPGVNTAPTTWNTSGTLLGMNAITGFAGSFVDFHVNGGVSQFLVGSTGGIVSVGGYTTSAGNVSAAGGSVTASGGAGFVLSGRTKILSGADGRLNLTANAGGAATRFTFGAETTAVPAFAMSSTNINTVLGDGTAGGTLTAGNIAAMQSCGTTTTCSATAIATGARIVFGSAPLVSGTPSTAAITGISPAFTSSSSYVCTLAGQSSATTGLYSVANVSGSAFTITGPAATTTVVNYICAGN